MLFATPSFTPRERLLTVIVLANVAITSILLLSSGAAPLSEKLDNRIEGIDISTARYIDLTHVIEPGMPLWGAFAQPIFLAARAAVGMDGFIATGEEFTYAKQGFVATEVTIPTDQIGTQLDVPAHWNDWGATLTDVPATVTLRPLVVVDITDGVRSDPGYHAQVEDVERWEEAHGKVPNRSVVLFRSDWSRGWVEYTRTGKMPDAFPGVSLAALKFLHGERQILVHGHEPLDTDMTPSLEGEEAAHAQATLCRSKVSPTCTRYRQRAASCPLVLPRSRARRAAWHGSSPSARPTACMEQPSRANQGAASAAAVSAAARRRRRLEADCRRSADELLQRGRRFTSGLPAALALQEAASIN